MEPEGSLPCPKEAATEPPSHTLFL